MPDLDEIGPLHAPAVATVAGLAGLVAGLFTFAAGAQLFTLLLLWGWAEVIPPLLVGFGATMMGVGGLTTRGSAKSAVALSLLAGLSALVGFGWFVFALVNGFFSLLTLIAAGLSGCVALLAPIAVPACLQVEARRQKLLAES